jgi:hypothetical protein
MPTIVVHRCGVSVKEDYKLVWEAITAPPLADVAPMIEKLIKKQRNREDYGVSMPAQQVK